MLKRSVLPPRGGIFPAFADHSKRAGAALVPGAAPRGPGRLQFIAGGAAPAGARAFLSSQTKGKAASVTSIIAWKSSR